MPAAAADNARAATSWRAWADCAALATTSVSGSLVETARRSTQAVGALVARSATMEGDGVKAWLPWTQRETNSADRSDRADSAPQTELGAELSADDRILRESEALLSLLRSATGDTDAGDGAAAHRSATPSTPSAALTSSPTAPPPLPALLSGLPRVVAASTEDRHSARRLEASLDDPKLLRAQLSAYVSDARLPIGESEPSPLR